MRIQRKAFQQQAIVRSRQILTALLVVGCVGLWGCGDEPPVPDPKAKIEEAQARCMTLYFPARGWKQARGMAPPTVLAVMEDAAAPEDEVTAPQDPWGHEYDVLDRDDVLRIRSRGPDGKADTDDDLAYPPLD